MPDTFTPEQIAQILEEFFKVVGTRQYIGARYVPIFGRKDEESIEWDNTAPYEPLTIVLYQGNSYTSRQFVPVGVEITNQEFWAITGNYNAQVEMYRRETAEARALAEQVSEDLTAEQTARADADTSLANDIAAEAQTRANDIAAEAQTRANDIAAEAQTRANDIAAEAQTRAAADTSLSGRLDTAEESITNINGEINTLKLKDIFVIFGDSWSAFGEGFENWMEYVNIANTLDVEVKNFAIGGAGYLVPGNTIATQIATANSNMTSEEKARTKYVIMEGGVNDTGVSGLTYTNFRNTVRSAITNVASMFPNAQIIYAPNMCSYAYDATRAGLCMSYFYKMKDDIKWTPGNVKSAPILPYFWLGFKYSEVFRADNLHLNRYGAYNFGKCILDACLGMSQDVLKHYYKLGNLLFIYDDTGNVDISGTYDFTGNSGVIELTNEHNEFTEFLYMWTNVSPLMSGTKRNPFWTGMTADCANHGWIRYDGNYVIKANSDYTGNGTAHVFF